MSKRLVNGRKRRRTKIAGQFAPRLVEMLGSWAYRALSLSARRVLDRLEIELGSHGGTDNGRLPCTYDNFHEYGIDRHAIAPAIREAVALGFVEVTEHGTAGNAEWRRPNLFRLTYRHTERANPTDDWRKIETKEQAAEIARAARYVKPRHRFPVGVNTKTNGGNPHRKRRIHSGKTPTTVHSGKTPTTLDISGGGTLRRRGPKTQRPSLAPNPLNGSAQRARRAWEADLWEALHAKPAALAAAIEHLAHPDLCDRATAAEAKRAGAGLPAVTAERVGAMLNRKCSRRSRKTNRQPTGPLQL